MKTIGQMGYDTIDTQVYNGHASADIKRHDAVSFEAATTALKLTINPYAADPGPLDSQGNVLIFGCEPSPASAGPVVGIANQLIRFGEWGSVRVLGYGRCNVHTATSQIENVAYGRGAGAAGRLIDVTIATAIAACSQIGTSGATTAGDPRDVFIDCRVQLIGYLGIVPWA